MPAHKRQLCPRGHDTYVVGRYSGGRCKACPTAPTREWDNARKREAIAYKGSACADCGFVFGDRTEVAQFDHVQPRETAAGRAVHRTRKGDLHAELDKCDLVCANCHATRTRSRLLSAS